MSWHDFAYCSTPVRPAKPFRSSEVAPNSLFQNVLPASPLFSIFCTSNRAYLHENKDQGRGGGGGWRSKQNIRDEACRRYTRGDAQQFESTGKLTRHPCRHVAGQRCPLRPPCSPSRGVGLARGQDPNLLRRRRRSAVGLHALWP